MLLNTQQEVKQMPRHYKKKGVHTSPEKAGRKNLEGVDLPKDEMGLMDKLMPVYDKGKVNRGIYKGQWSDEDLDREVGEYFSYCRECELKPTVPSLLIWLAISRQTLNEWRTKPDKYGVKSDIIGTAYHIMESYLQGNIDKYPTGSIFLLKTTHGHVDATKVDVTSNGNTLSNTPAEVNEAISRLGLDKKED